MRATPNVGNRGRLPAFRLDEQDSLVSPKTLRHYEWTIGPFLRWLDEEHPHVACFEQLGVDLVRENRVWVRRAADK